MNMPTDDGHEAPCGGTVLVCDDHRLFTDSLAVALEGRNYRVLGRIYRAHDIAAASREHEVDVCLMDRYFPDGDGLEVIPDILRGSPRTRIVVLSGSSEPDLVTQALSVGASGVAGKHEGIDVIVDAIERVRRGEAVSACAKASPVARKQTRPTELTRFLTGRELQVLALLVEGKPTVEIGQAMGITYSTTRTHIQSLLTKLGAHSKLQAVALAVGQDITSEA